MLEVTGFILPSSLSLKVTVILFLTSNVVFSLTAIKFTQLLFSTEAELETYIRSRNYENDNVSPSSRLSGICAAFVIVKSENDEYEIKLRYDDTNYNKKGVANKQEVPTTKNRVIDTLTK